MLSNGQKTHTYLHTALTKIGSKQVKIVIDNGCDATLVTKSFVEKLGLSPKNDNQNLKITTINGQSEITSRSVTININDVSIKAFVLESNIHLEPQPIDLKVMWPSLDKELAKEVKRNLTGGHIDVIIGLDELYGKITDGSIIQHPHRRLILMKTIFGYSLGGSSLEKENTEYINDICGLMSKFDVTYEKSEPTLQLEIIEPHQQSEMKIQQNMDEIFHQETENLDNGDQAKSEDEEYAEHLFHKHLQFRDGRYWTKPLFKKDFKPMLNNYNLCIKRYNALRRQLSKDPALEKAYTEEIHKLVKKGNVEKVDENPLFASDPNRYLNYLPQVCVARQDKLHQK